MTQAARFLFLTRPEFEADARQAALSAAAQSQDVRILVIDDAVSPPVYERDGIVRIQRGIALQPIAWMHHLANRTAGLSSRLSGWLEARAQKRSAKRIRQAWTDELAFLRPDKVICVGENLPVWARQAGSSE